MKEKNKEECIKCGIERLEYLRHPVICYADSSGSVEHEFCEVVYVQLEGF